MVCKCEDVICLGKCNWGSAGALYVHLDSCSTFAQHQGPRLITVAKLLHLRAVVEQSAWPKTRCTDKYKYSDPPRHLWGCCLTQRFLIPVCSKNLQKWSSEASLNAGSGHVSCWTHEQNQHIPPNPGVQLRAGLPSGVLHPSFAISHCSQESGSNPGYIQSRQGEMLDLGLGVFEFLDQGTGWEELSSLLSFHLQEEMAFRQFPSMSYTC